MRNPKVMIAASRGCAPLDGSVHWQAINRMRVPTFVELLATRASLWALQVEVERGADELASSESPVRNILVSDCTGRVHSC